MTLHELLALFTSKNIEYTTAHLDAVDQNAQLTDVASDSREVTPGSLFVCKGASFSPAYLASAVEAGAVAYLCQQSLAEELQAVAPNVAAICVDDVRLAMAYAAAGVAGHPDKKLTTIGITGTKGKSTCSYMLRAILDGDEPYSKCGVIGGIEVFDGKDTQPAHNTTPEAPELWRHLKHAAEAGLPYVDMEISSQGLKYDRTVGLNLSVAVFLNIGTDHISPVEHPTFEDYFESKLKIFDLARVAIINKNTMMFDQVMERAQKCEKVLTFSTTDSDATVWADEITPHQGMVTFTVHTPTWTGAAALPMSGLFNVENALAAITVADYLGIREKDAVLPLMNVKVPGRMELLSSPDNKVTGLVDYAHNKLSYQKLFSSTSKEFPGYGRYVVMGAVGGKAYNRRQELPEEAAKWADLMIYTTEDCNMEDPAVICAQMAEATPEGAAHKIILDRYDAIYEAVSAAYDDPRPALVYLLAKGDEPFNIIGGKHVSWMTDAAAFKAAVRAKLDERAGRAARG